MASSTKFKIESGTQLLARLRKKSDIQNFYPILFENGPKCGDIIEISSESSMSCLLVEIISELLTSSKSVDIEVLLVNTDGHFNYDDLLLNLNKKMPQQNANMEDVQKVLKNFYMMNVYDATQIYSTLHNLEIILMENCKISVVIFNTLTAFYWSEQGFKITKMDLYIKNLIKLIQKVNKDYKTTCFYTKPGYFGTSYPNISLQNDSTIDQPLFRLNLIENSNGNYKLNIKTVGTDNTRYFDIVDGILVWQ